MKARNQSQKPDVSKEKIAVKNVTTEPLNVIESEKTLEVLPFTVEDIRTSKWLHMDKLESEKLEWMKPLEPQKETHSHTEARFDFEGSLIVKTEEYSVKQGLHHHGDDPEKAGYTIGEMMTFIESSSSSQKLIGLRCLGMVMEKAHKGFYDLCFNSSIIKQVLEETIVVLMVRKCLDDSSASIVSAAISCLRGLVYNTDLDELFLDRIFACNFDETSVPELAPEMEAIKMDETKDEQLVKMDPVRALLRSDLLIRVRYLIENNLKQQDDPLVLRNLFDILIRVARHSKGSVKEIANCPYLLETIVSNFLKAQLSAEAPTVYSNPFPAALKLLRIMCATDTGLIPLLVKKFPDLLRAAQIYITIEPNFFAEQAKFSPNEALKLTIESLRFWCTLLRSREPLIASSLVSLFPVLIRQTQYLVTLKACEVSVSSFDWQFAACLLLCLRGLTAQESHVEPAFGALIQLATFQWISEMTNSSILPTMDVINALSQAIIYCLGSCRSKDDVLLVTNKALMPFITSGTLWARIMENLTDCSSAINFKQEHTSSNREAANLPSFGSLVFGQSDARVVPALKSNSTLPLVHSLIKVALAANQDTLANHLLSDGNIVNYVSSVASSRRPHLSESTSRMDYFEYQEALLLSDICLLMGVSGDLKANYLALSLGLISFIKEEPLKRRLLDLVIFNESLYRANLTEKLADLSLNDDEKSLVCQSQQCLISTKDTYRKWSDMDSALWVFDPIANQIKVLEEDKKDIDSVRLTLLFIILLKKRAVNYFHQVMPSIELEFCLIASVFVAANDFFLDNEIALALSWFLNYFQSKMKVKLSKTSQTQLSKLSMTIADFYANLTDQFDSVSYNDPVFKAYLDMFADDELPR
ncbi:RNA polymerase II-associated protein 1 [Halotydeus destructor]|nr:RNA polymerase II-associated protein 1 [Halotydeus destructor]